VKKHVLLFSVLWVFSIGYNLLKSMMYPDTSITIMNLVVSIVYLFFGIYFVYYLLKKEAYNILRDVSKIGIISGLLIFVFKAGFHFITVPLYVIFITPLFGLNYFALFSIGVMSISCSTFYLFIYLVQLYYSKKGAVSA